MNLSLAFSPFSTEVRPTDPEKKHLLAPTLFIMGEKSKYRPNRFFDSGSASGHVRNPLRDEILKASGFDLSKPETLPVPIFSTTNPQGLYRRLWYIFQENSREFCLARRKGVTPLFSKRGNEVALTEAGVAKAAEIRDSFSKEGNVTSVWFEGFFGEGGYDKLIKAMEKNPSMQKEVGSGEVLDNIHGYIAVAIHRDSFQRWLVRGDTPTFNQIAQWVVRWAISGFRKHSHDGLGRHLRGARTDLERSQGKMNVAGMLPTTYSMVLQEGEDDNPETAERAIVNNAETEHVFNKVSWAHGMDKVTNALRRQKAGNPDRYARVLDMMVQRMSAEDVALVEKVSVNRAASILADARNALRRARDEADNAKMIMAYLQEEPYACLEDIQADVKITAELDPLVDELIHRGRIRKVRGSYCLTDSGKSLLESWADQNEPDLATLVSF